MATARSNGDGKSENHEFQADVAKILHLMVHSVYSEKEVFLRELISNASDACDKLRYLSLTDPDLVDGAASFRIDITSDKTKREICVADNGVGMDKDELIENLGTIARSGTGRFIEQLTGDSSKDTNLIGQFGVGFYSVFMVAERVEVTSRRAGQDACWTWRSDGLGSYEVSPADSSSELPDRQGTLIRLQLRKGEDEFLDIGRLRGIIKNYSDHIAIPVYLADMNDTDSSPERVNAASALWTRQKSDISEDQYKEFYRHVAHAFDEPLLRIHYKAEGRHEYHVLLFIPESPPLDLFDPRRAARTKLYVRRVFITEDAELLPGYLRFVRGIVDSEDMPLNISREMLQNNPLVRAIKTALTKRVLGEIKKLSEKRPEDFLKLWECFGAVLKEGVYEDPERRENLLELARFRTTQTDTWRSLKDYCANMKDGQKAIYFIHGENESSLSQSPQLEGFTARGIEVLLLSDPVDAFWTSVGTTFNELPFRAVNQGTADLESLASKESDGSDGEHVEAVDETALATLIALFKQVLGYRVADVQRSKRLTDSPVCLVSKEGALDPYLQRIVDQSQGKGASDPLTSQVLEINPRHSLICALAKLAKSGRSASQLEDAAHLLLDQARILEGAPVIDRIDHARRLASAIEKGLTNAAVGA